MKVYNVARTVVYYFEVKAQTESDALEIVSGLSVGFADDEDLVLEQVVQVQEIA